MMVLRLAGFFGIITLFATSLPAFPTGDFEKGKALFHDQTFAGSTRGMSCSSCHADGKGLENAGNRRGWRIMGNSFKHLEDAVNYMIVTALHGKAIDPQSEKMDHIVAYIKSL
jgi:cytochrome c peroxidase